MQSYPLGRQFGSYVVVGEQIAFALIDRIVSAIA